MRPLGSHNTNERAAELERLLEEGINSIGLGPQGMSGNYSVMEVHIKNTARHPSVIGTAVNVGCWSHRRLVECGRQLPINLEGGTIFPAGPIIRPAKGLDGRYEMVSVGPATSMRMEKLEKEFIKRTGVKLIVGKGRMAAETVGGCREYKALHCIFPAGCAVVAATEVEEIENEKWEDLGMPETLWTLPGPGIWPSGCFY